MRRLGANLNAIRGGRAGGGEFGDAGSRKVARTWSKFVRGHNGAKFDTGRALLEPRSSRGSSTARCTDKSN